METKELNIKGKIFFVHELLAEEFDETSKIENTIERIKSLVKVSCNLSDEDYKKLTIKERSELMNSINQLNGWTEDFQKSETQEKKD